MGALTRILVADDEPEIRVLLQHLLIREGFEVELAANGLEALDMAKADPPDLLLLDLLMPVMGGLDACRRIRMDPSIGRLPIILLSGEFTEIEEELVSGPDDYLAKPFDTGDVLARIRRLAKRVGPEDEVVSSRREAGRPDDQAIMIVDDEVAVRKLVTRSLKRFYPLARFAEAAGLDEAKRKLMDSRPRLVILDLRLPDGSGLDLCRFMQGHPWFYETRVLIITGYPSARTRDQTFRRGASEFLPKPFEMKELADSVGRLLA